MGDWTGTVPTSFLAGAKLRGVDQDTLADIAEALTSDWTTYALAWTSGGSAPSIGNGTLSGFYRRLNKTVNVLMIVTFGSTTTFGTGQYFLSLPSTAVRAAVGAAYLLDNGTANKSAIAITTTSLNTISLVHTTSDVAATVPHTWANTDAIRVAITYQDP